MIKRNIIYIGFASIFLLIGCTKEINEAPTSVELKYPTENLLCIDSQINFEWSEATDAENEEITYNIMIAKDRLSTNIVEDINISESNIILTLSRDTAYYWTVIAIDTQGNKSDASPMSAFYTKGDGVENSAPFTAELVAPTLEATVPRGSLDLSWLGSDADTADRLTYDVFFGEEANSLPLKQGNLPSSTYNVTVASGKTYYWKVNTTDNNGAKSIGQTWVFTVN